jgi:copper transport protein
VRAATAATLALVVAGVLAPAAGAHAVLARSDPDDGAALARAPRHVRLQFTEEISSRFRFVRVVDGSGRRVAARVRQSTAPRTLELDVPRLKRGTYEVTWKVLAEADGHVTEGALVFGVGTTAQGGAHVLPSPSPLDVTLRWLDFLLLALLCGGIAMSFLLARAAVTKGLAEVAVRSRQRVLALAGLGGGLALLLGGALLVREAVAIPAGSVADLLGTRWGSLWLAREVLLASLVATVVLLRRRGSPHAYATAGALAAGLALTRSLGGHAAAASGVPVAVDALHLLAAALWIGVLVALVVAGRQMARGSIRTVALGASVCATLVVVTGLYSAGVQVASVDALVTTFYGRTLVAKFALVLAAGGLGVVNVLFRPALRVIVAEAAVGLGVLLCAAVLTETPPARGPQFAPPRLVAAPTLARQVDDLLVSVAVRPNRPGANIVTVDAVSSRRPPPAPIDGVVAGTARLRELQPGRYVGGLQLEQSGRDGLTVVVQRAGRRLTAPFAWTVSAPDPAQPVVVSSRPLAPLLHSTAALLLLASALSAVWLTRRRFPWRASPILREEAR